MEEAQQEQSQQPEAVLLAPLAIPKRNYGMAGVSRYRAYRADGTYELVEAFFAAEVPAKCSFDEIERIERETQKVMQSIPQESVVKPEAPEFVETKVEADTEEAPAFITVDLAEVTQSREDLFESFDLSQLHPQKEEAEPQGEISVESTTHNAAQVQSVVQGALAEGGAVEPPAQPISEAEVELPQKEEVVEAKAAPEIPKERIEEPEAELSQDEIEALLNE